MARQEIAQGALSSARVLSTRTLLWLAVIGVFPLSLAPWGTWVIRQQAARFSSTTTTLTYFQQSLRGIEGLAHFLVAHGLATPILLQSVGWFGLAVAPAGIFPALALVWSRGNARAMRAYFTWLVAVTALAAAEASQLFGESYCYTSRCRDSITIVSRQPGWGAWVAIGALVLLWVAAAARIFTPRAAFLSSTSRLPSAPQHAVGVSRLTVLRRTSAAVFTVGTLVWGVGLTFVPWATSHCTGFPITWAHYLHASCATLDSNDAITSVWHAPILERGFDFTLFLVFMGLLGIITMGVLWRTRWSGPIIATSWAALATWLVLQLSAGLAAMLQHPPKFTGSAPAGAWVSGAGPLVTGAGLAIVGIAVLGAWIAALSPATRSYNEAKSDLTPMQDAASAESIEHPFSTQCEPAALEHSINISMHEARHGEMNL